MSPRRSKRHGNREPIDRDCSYCREEKMTRPEAIRDIIDPELQKLIAADKNERTNEIGLYHYAVSYHRAADALGTIKFNTTHPDAPRYFLYFHAIELYIKAFLRNAGRSVRQIEALGHRAGKLERAYLKYGGTLEDEDREILALMEQT